MHKLWTAIICSLLLPMGVAMALTAGDKKGGDRDDKDKGGPVVIIIWDDAWPPVIR